MTGDTAFKFYKIMHKISDPLALEFGKIHVRRGAYSAQTPKFHTYRFDSIVPYLPAKFQTGAALIYNKASHKFTLQFLNGDNNKLESNTQQTGEDLSYQFQINSKWSAFKTIVNLGIANYGKSYGTTLVADRRSVSNFSFGLNYSFGDYYTKLDLVSVNTESYQTVEEIDGLETLADQSAIDRSSIILMIGKGKGTMAAKT